MQSKNTNGQHAIRHRVEIETPVEKLYAALTEADLLASWWTTRVDATPREGSTASFGFGDGSHQVRMKVEELVPNRRVRWTCTEGPWQGMSFTFELSPHEKGSALRFENAGWSEQDDFFMHCNSKWGFFLSASLKSYLEGGQGVPHPNEPKI